MYSVQTYTVYSMYSIYGKQQHIVCGPAEWTPSTVNSGELDRDGRAGTNLVVGGADKLGYLLLLQRLSDTGAGLALAHAAVWSAGYMGKVAGFCDCNKIASRNTTQERTHSSMTEPNHH